VRRVPCDIDCGVGKQSCVLCGRVITSRSSTATATAAITEQTCVMRACVRVSPQPLAQPMGARARAPDRMLSVCLHGKCTDGGTPEVGHRGPRANARKRCRLEEGQKTNYSGGKIKTCTACFVYSPVLSG